MTHPNQNGPDLINPDEVPFNLVSDEQPDPRPALESERRSRATEQAQTLLFKTEPIEAI